MRCFLLLLLAVLGAAQYPTVYPNYQPVNPKFYRLNGKTADQCVNKNAANGDCVASEELPEPSVLVLVPTTQSRPTLATPRLTILGKGFPVGCANCRLGLGAAGGAGCTAAASQANAGATLAANLNVPVGGASLSFDVPNTWRTQSLELESSGRRLCLSFDNGGTWRYTGFKVSAVWDCDTTLTVARNCNSLPYGAGLPATDPAGTDLAIKKWAPGATATDAAGNAIWTTSNLNAAGEDGALLNLSPFEQILRTRRTQCIRHTKWGANDVELVVGQCVNPNVTGICQGTAYDPATQRCCDPAQSLVQTLTAPCPCRPDGSAQSPVCSTGRTCCYQTKYAELTSLFTDSTKAAWPEYYGECYNPVTQRCCDTGYRFDPTSEQCCAINGIQTLNAPCPCDADMDCRDGTPNTVSMYCCKQQWPTPFEAQESVFTQSDTKQSVARCNKYNNFPSSNFPDATTQLGTSPYMAQRCLGSCLDERFQICCNGMACRREFDVCCNATCCNKYLGGCIEGRIPGTPNNRYNYNELDQPYELCSYIEVMNPLRGFWVFVWPAYLLLMTCVCLAFVIAFVSKVSRRSFSFLERAIIILALFAILFGFPCYFAPVYKYGVWIVVVSLFTIVVAGARNKGLNIVLVVVQFLTIMYLFDPFTGNNYVGFSSDRVANGDPDPESAGILHSVYKMFHARETFGNSFPQLQDRSIAARRFCVNFYDYFLKDAKLQDFRRDNIEVASFGYCSHGWVTALIIFEGISLIIALVLFLLDLVALILRFKEERSYEPIELEVRGAEEVPQY